MQAEVDELRLGMQYLDKELDKDEWLETRTKIMKLIRRPQPTMAEVEAEFVLKHTHSPRDLSSDASFSPGVVNVDTSTPVTHARKVTEHVSPLHMHSESKPQATHVQPRDDVVTHVEAQEAVEETQKDVAATQQDAVGPSESGDVYEKPSIPDTSAAVVAIEAPSEA